jgi:hypothetical protein
VAGVGSSPVVAYQGLGAYFLDKLEDGVWRLEVMPDAVQIRDPFERASPKKEVTRIQWQLNAMQVMLPDLGTGFSIKGLNEGNTYTATAADNFKIAPGTYLLTRNGKNTSTTKTGMGAIQLNEFVAPQATNTDFFVQLNPLAELTAGKPFVINAQVVGMDTGRVSLQVSRLGAGQPRTIPMRKNGYNYAAELPSELLTPGVLNYRIIAQQGSDVAVFPGNFKDNPFAWDTYTNETWKAMVTANDARLELFNPAVDRDARAYPSFRRGFQINYLPGEKPGELLLKLAATELLGDHTIGFQYAFAKKLKGRSIDMVDKLMIRARTAETTPVQAKITLTNADAFSFSTYITLNNDFRDIEVPLNNLAPDASLLLPRPYPGFLPTSFTATGSPSPFRLQEIEKIQVTIGTDVPAAAFNKPYSMEVQSVWLQKSK